MARAHGDGQHPALDRIMIFRKHPMTLKNHVNPIYIKSVEQIHMVGGTPAAIPTNHDLL
jgi:hypothetical protein